ncbi:MAG: hypothetical protein JWM78_1287 [Verrucomicrobiaceae bacterium]|nr:hypothetical protein [Verrucomicrobiaceae bacterium]
MQTSLSEGASLKNSSVLNKTELRKFGFVFSAILVVLFSGLLPWLKAHPVPLWPFYLAVPITLLAAAIPAALRPLYIVWMKFGAVMGFINTRIIMGVFFFVILTPVAWILRIAGKDFLSRKLLKSAPSYRVASQQYAKEDMEKPY